MNLSHDEILAQIKKERLVAILRGVSMEQIPGVVEALVRGGIRILEFTFDHGEENYLEVNAEKIRYASQNYGDQIIVGCGTATCIEDVDTAYYAGASLVISPNVSKVVIEKTRALGMVSMPGALTPTEIVHAWEAGADIVKLFPAGELGTGYIKAVRGPLGYIPMSAVGGVKPENVDEFLNAGVCGFGVGGQLVLSKAIKNGDYTAIEARAREFVTAIQKWEAKN